jgi:hypothetical protein
MIDRTAFMRGPVRHMFRIGQLEEHKALRERNEARLAALKANRRNYEQEHEKPAAFHLTRALESLQ